MKLVKRGIVSLCAAVLLTGTTVIAKPIEQGSSSKSNQLIGSAGERSTSQIRAQEIQKLFKEAVDVVNETREVLVLLNHHHIKTAKKRLKDLKQKLDKLEKKYSIKKFPVDVIVSEIVGDLDLKTAERMAKEVKRAVNLNDFVRARFLLNALRDEVVIETTYLPIDLYKQAVDLAYKFLEENKIDNAISQLEIALGTLEIKTVIIPRPLAIASILVEDASKIYKKDYKTALKLLEEARRKIKLAKVLGYVRTDREIKPLLEEIDKLEDAVRKKQKNSKDLFRKLIEKIKEMGKGQTQ